MSPYFLCRQGWNRCRNLSSETVWSNDGQCGPSGSPAVSTGGTASPPARVIRSNRCWVSARGSVCSCSRRATGSRLLRHGVGAPGRLRFVCVHSARTTSQTADESGSGQVVAEEEELVLDGGPEPVAAGPDVEVVARVVADPRPAGPRGPGPGGGRGGAGG